VPSTDGVLHTGAVAPTASALLPEQQTRLGRLLHPRGQQPSSAPISSLPMISSARGHRRFVSKQQSLNRRPILVLLNDSSRVCQAAATQFCIHENGALSAPIRRAGDAAASPAKQPSRRVLTARPAWLLPDKRDRNRRSSEMAALIEHQRSLIPAVRPLSPPGVAAVDADREPDLGRSVRISVALGVSGSLTLPLVLDQRGSAPRLIRWC
jgi:hypothetical protein